MLNVSLDKSTVPKALALQTVVLNQTLMRNDCVIGLLVYLVPIDPTSLCKETTLNWSEKKCTNESINR